jgi:membrane fusion protein (multidrug efflux system)
MKKLAIGGALLALLLGVGALSFWAGTRNASGTPAPSATAPAKAPGSPPPGIAIEAVAVTAVRLPNALAAVGSLRSDETVIVRPEIPGRVAEIHFREGERVTKNQLLVRIDDSVQKADTNRASANLVLQKSKHDRALDLRNKGFISTQAKDEAENQLKVAEADAESMRARLAKMEIRAPFSGTVGLRSVSVGDYVKEGQDMVNLEAVDPLKVDFRVPEVYLAHVRNGQTLQLTVDAIAGKSWDGQVVAINPLLDANGRSIVVRARVPNGGGALRPGMFARVMLFTSDMKDSVMVPEESLFPVGDEKYVYRVVDGKAQRQKVDIGLRRDGKVEIRSGLGSGDVVVTAGQMKLREGVAVHVANMPTPSGPAVGKADDPVKAKGSS